VLDHTGGRQDPMAWGLAFVAISLCVFVGVLALKRGMRAAPAS